MNQEDMKQWINDNLVMQEEGMKITNQSKSGFIQSLNAGAIKPFIEFGSTKKTRLYLKSDLEVYARTKRIR